jgi:WD40 repeat protein
MKPDEKDPDGKDPDGKDPDGKDPDGKDPDGKDPSGTAAQKEKDLPTSIDPAQTHLLSQYKHEEPLTTLRCDPTGRFVAAGAVDLDVQLWSLEDGKRRTLKGHDSWVRSIEFSGDGTRMFTACWGGVVKCWDLAQDEPAVIYSIQAHQGSARFVRISPDGNSLVTCGNDLLVKTWNSADGKPKQKFTGHKRHIYGAEFHPDGQHIVSQDVLGIVKIWNIGSGKDERTIEATMMTGYDKKFAADMGGSRDLHFRGDGKQWASAGITNLSNGFAGVQDPIIVIFDWETGKPVKQLRADNSFKGIAWGVRFHLEGFLVGAGANKNGKGELWFYKPDEEKAFHTVKLPHAARGLDLIGNDRLAVPFSDGNVAVYSMTQPEA